MSELLGAMPTYEAYKDSGVEWLGEIPAHWEKRRLRFLIDLIVSNVDKHSKVWENPITLCNYVDVYKNNYITNEISFMEATATSDEVDRFKIKINDVLITKDSEDWLDIGVPALVKYEERNLLCGYHLAILRAYNIINGSFLFWALSAQYSKIQFSVRANGITRYGISHGVIKDSWLMFPALSEQTTIVKFLDYKTSQIDQAITIKEKQITLLREHKQILIQNAVTRGLDPDAPMRDSGLEWIGEVPAYWEVIRFKNLFSQSHLPVRKDDGVVTSYRDGQVTLRSNRRLEGYTEAIIEQGYQGIRKGQLVLNSMDAFEGAIGVSESDGKCTPEYVVCDPLSNQFLPEYFAYLLREMALIKYIRVICNAVRQRAVRIRFNNLAKRFLIVPPLKEQTAIVNHIETQSATIDKAIGLYEQQIEKLREYKATLINSAVTGKIKVPMPEQTEAAA
ncbi:restriction endonuclease subunit S [Desulfosarcina ovata]|uniref:Type I restriction endonuclease subunit S n=1 Tax=Desulfosarcina ovata subsp. ovata TaxID=2752305 RepID=A0A5K8AGQ1_9BACT|nr:restriction endonuclease subunit S [Desulfosarcina ovata]BBO91030.1 type I restriction endonuclease subunit S [Desulfosarcina ovata subsp. ovata]